MNEHDSVFAVNWMMEISVEEINSPLVPRELNATYKL